ARLGIAIERDFEKGGAVEYDPGRIPAFFVGCGGRNRYNEGNGGTILMVESGNTGPIVTHPNRAVGGDGHAPGVDQVWIGMGRHASDVGLKIGPTVGIGARRDRTK